MINILIIDEINICIVEFNYYIENHTLETNFSHVISAESHTEAASWIVQLSSDSPDINILLDPIQVYTNSNQFHIKYIKGFHEYRNFVQHAHFHSESIKSNHHISFKFM